MSHLCHLKMVGISTIIKISMLRLKMLFRSYRFTSDEIRRQSLISLSDSFS
ncbi:hypothetical protein XBKB1_3480002 [Xenorhabdus bovienii str. kraussei Becker Underwood]|uniref:Uncharacterized protein n=1 Tax=Xenorhabdus bovienii str. kraussei Becker Underwood TaxID=1398204 RepID=A0A077PV91_XENBV|nr:hypothetical protein XBKB1_3480002 [Xenorhabdus bovienii str. kraussei Becker Underwood]